MEVRVLFFGIVRDITGVNEAVFSLSPGDTLGSLIDGLSARFPGLEESMGLSFAVNESYAETDREIKPNDVVAVIPPVSGG